MLSYALLNSALYDGNHGWKSLGLVVVGIYAPMSQTKLMTKRRSTVEHPFGTIKAWMGATHFQMRRLRNVRTEMALHVLAYNIKRMIGLIGVEPLLNAIRHLRIRMLVLRSKRKNGEPGLAPSQTANDDTRA